MGEGSGEGLGAYRRDIDGLRAVAVLAVVAFHVGLPGTSGGFVGVDVFFVISGFLITGLLAKEVALTGTIALAAFYARRVRRLLPALAVVLLTTLALGALVLSPRDAATLARSGLATAAFVSNLFFSRAAGDYFAGETGRMPLLHTWSLAVEEQFYMVWPALLLGVALSVRRRPGAFRSRTLAVLTLVVAASLLASWWGTARVPLAAFYMTPFRAWEFGLGGLLALSGYVARRRWEGEALGLAGLAAIGASTVAFDSETPFPGLAALVPVLGTLAVIAGGSRGEGQVWRGLGSAPLVRIGQLSYSWYLWHWPLLTLGRIHALGEPSRARDLALALLALALAELTYRLVEDPVRRRKPWLFASTRGSLAMGAAISVSLAGVAAASLHQARSNVDDVDDAAPINPGCNGFVARDQCTRGAWGGSPGLVIWGDSHARRLASLVDAFATEGRLPMLQRTHIACPPLEGVTSTGPNRRPNLSCSAFNRSVQEEIAGEARLHRVTGVVLAARWANYLDNPDDDRTETRRSLVAGGTVLDHAGAVSALRTSLQRRVDGLSRAGLRVLIVADLPEFPWPVPECVRLRGAAACGVARAEVETWRAEALAVLREVASGRENVRLFDAVEAFCSSERCESVIGGEVMYADRHHLTHRAAVSLLPRARSDLRWLAGP